MLPQKCREADSPNVWLWMCLSGNKREPSAAAAAWLVSQSLRRAISFPAWASPASLRRAFRQRILIMSHSAVTEATLLLWWAACWEGLHTPSLSFYSGVFLLLLLFIFIYFFVFAVPSSKCLVHCSESAKCYHQDRSHMLVFNNLLLGGRHTTLGRVFCARIS